MSEFTLVPSGQMDGTKDLSKDGKSVPCYLLQPLVTQEGLIRLPCNSKCLHFNLVTEGEGENVKVFAQFTCGGIGVKKLISNAEAKPVSNLIKV